MQLSLSDTKKALAAAKKATSWQDFADYMQFNGYASEGREDQIFLESLESYSGVLSSISADEFKHLIDLLKQGQSKALPRAAYFKQRCRQVGVHAFMGNEEIDDQNALIEEYPTVAAVLGKVHARKAKSAAQVDVEELAALYKDINTISRKLKRLLPRLETYVKVPTELHLMPANLALFSSKVLDAKLEMEGYVKEKEHSNDEEKTK